MKHSILFVDDEKPILNTLLRSFRGSEFDVFTAENGQAALAIVARESIDIIISDMRMPNMTGHQLLRDVKELSPTTIRLILSGHAEEKDIIRAMLDGSCKMYILKPWDNQSLHKTIRQMLAIREQLKDHKLLTIVNGLEGLCALPRIIHQLTDLLDRDADMKEVAALIEDDPILTAKVLQLVNSAFYSIKTGSIHQAIVFLGLNSVKNIVLLTCFSAGIPNHKIGPFNKEAYWRHASLTNRLINQLYHKLLGQKLPPIASSVGLLFGIGLLVLVNKMPEKYAEIIARFKKTPELSLVGLEREILGVTHQDVGGHLLDWWGMPQPIIESAMFYHDPFNQNVTEWELVAIVHIANYYSLKMLYPDISVHLDERTFELFNTTHEKCTQILEKALE